MLSKSCKTKQYSWPSPRPGRGPSSLVSPGARGGARTIFLLSPLVGTDHYNGPHPTLCPPVTGNCHSKIKQRHGETQNIWRGSNKAFPHWMESTILRPGPGLGWGGSMSPIILGNVLPEMCPISAEMRAMTRTGPALATNDWQRIISVLLLITSSPLK